MAIAPGEAHPPAPPRRQASQPPTGHQPSTCLPHQSAMSSRPHRAWPHHAWRTTAGPRSGFSVPRGLIAGTLVATALVWGPYAIIPRSSLLLRAGADRHLPGPAPAHHLQPPRQGAARPDAAAVHPQPADAAAARDRHQPVRAGDPGNPRPRLRQDPPGPGRQRPQGQTRSGSSPNTAPAPATSATSSTTPTSGSGCASDCATAGSPASPPSAPTMTRSPASGRSSPGTRCAP